MLHRCVSECLEELSRIEEQRRLWLEINTDSSEISSFVECCCRLFDDSGLGDELDRGEHPYPPVIMEKFRTLDRLLRSIDGHQDAGAIINSPVMVPVRSLAAEILRELPPAPTK